MSCLIIRNSKGLITSVQTPTGERSQLFDAIHSNIYLGGSEQSANILKNAYADSVENVFSEANKYVYGTGEPQLFYQDSKGNYQTDLESLLISGNYGEISMGFRNPESGDFMQIGKFNTSLTTQGQFLTSMVRQGYMSAERVLSEDGITRFRGKGVYYRDQVMSARFIQDASYENFGVDRVKVNQDGTVEITFPSEYLTIQKKDGTTEEVYAGDIDESILKRTDIYNPVTLYIRAKGIMSKEAIYPLTESQSTQEKLILNSLNNFISTLGISVTTMEAYRLAYNNRHGQDPDIMALADMANRVIAVGEGANMVDLMTEEVAHVAVETYNDQASILEVITDIHLTPEYVEWASVYRQKYSNQYSGIDLEEAVRKEILGKVLARAVQNNFKDNNIAPEVRTLWQRFVVYIRSYLRPSHRRALQDIIDRISKDIAENNVSSFSTDNLGNGVYYSVNDTPQQRITTLLKTQRRTIESLYNTVLRNTGESYNKNALDKISDTMSENEIFTVMQAVARDVDTNLEVTRKKLNNIEKEPFSAIDIARYENIQSSLKPLLSQSINWLDTYIFSEDSSKKIAESISQEIGKIVLKSDTMEAEFQRGIESFTDTDIDRIVNGLEGITEVQKQEVFDQIKGQIKESSSISKWVGIASESRNPLIRIVNNYVSDMYVKVNNGFTNKVNEIVPLLEDEGLLNSSVQKGVIQKGTHYYISPIDMGKYDKELVDFRLQTLSEITGKTVEETQTERDKKSDAELLGSDINIIEYNKKIQKWIFDNGGQSRDQSYYQEQQQDLDDANVSEESQEIARNFRARTSGIRDKYLKNGVVDRSLYTESDRIIETRASQDYRVARSPISQYTSKIMDGLALGRFEDLTDTQKESIPKDRITGEYLVGNFKGDFIVLADGRSLDSLDSDARFALDMFNLDLVKRNNKRYTDSSRNPSQAFRDTILEKEAMGPNEAYRWAEANGSITATNEYYEAISNEGGISTNEIIQRFINDISDESKRLNKQSIFDALKTSQRERREIIKVFRDSKETMNTRVEDMSPTLLEVVRSLDEDIADFRQKLRLPKDLIQEQEFNESISKTRETNKSYMDMRLNSGKSDFDFSLDHMTRRNRTKTFDFAQYVKDTLEGYRVVSVNDSFEKFILEQVELGTILPGMPQSEVINLLKDAYAKSRVASYFTQYSPEGYKEAVAALRTGSIKLSELFDESNKEKLIGQYPGLKWVQLTPDYTWTDYVSDDSFVNPEYKDGMGVQPLFSKYKNPEFFNKYGIREEDYLNPSVTDILDLTATRNVDEFKYLQTLVGMRKEANDFLGQNNSNIYTRPQLTSNSFEKVISTLTQGNLKASIKDFAKDTFFNRADEKDYGETIDGVDIAMVGMKVPPKYFQTLVEDPKSLTQNTLEAELLNYREALKFRERNNIIGIHSAYKIRIANQNFTETVKGKSFITKKGQLSNDYAIVDNIGNYHIFGQKQTRKWEANVLGKTVDMTRVISKFQQFSSAVNLKFNPLVAGTSALTGIWNRAVDTFVGEHFHRSSARRAEMQVASAMAKFTSTAGNINKKSELNSVQEFLQIRDPARRLENSAMGKGTRLVSKLGFGLDYIGNLPVIPQIGYTILNDYRLIDGKFRSFTEYSIYRQNKSAASTKQEKKDLKVQITTEWKNTENQAIYDYLDITETGVKPSQRYLDQFSQDDFNELQAKMANKTRKLVQNIDGVITEQDKLAAQMDVTANTLLQHKGWLPLNLIRRLKKGQANFLSGVYEEGHYRTLLELAGNVMKNIQDPKKMLDIFRNLEDYQKTNLKRISIEMAGLAMVFALGFLIMGAEDDDDTWAEEYARLIFLRTYSEINTSNITGIYGSIKNTMKSPITMLSTLESIEKIPGSIMDLSKEGIGIKDVAEAALGVTTGKNIYKMTDLKTAQKNFLFFNKETVGSFAYPED